MKPRIAIPVPTTLDPAYNRRCLPLYLEALTHAGATPVELPLAGPGGTPTPARELQALADTCAGVLLPGSLADVDPARYGQPRDPASAPADPAREAADLLLLEDAAQHRKPVLGICYGLQLINVWRGGTLLQDLAPAPVNHPAGPSVAVAHTAAIAPDSLLAQLADDAESQPRSPHESLDHPIFGRLPVNSSHHQAVGIPGHGLRISARCPQDAVIEAVEADPAHPASVPGQLLLAVQWHPERSVGTSATSRHLFSTLVRAAATHGAA